MKFPQTMVQRHCHSPLGNLLLAASDAGLAMVYFDDQQYLPDWLQKLPHASPDHAVLRHASQQLKDYFAGKRHDFELPLDLSSGTEFQQAVWQTLLKIPYSRTWTYGAVADLIHKPSAVRAVGAAIGRNPLGIVVPCHRVIGSTGALTGYAGGLERKTYLLQLESGQNPHGTCC